VAEFSKNKRVRRSAREWQALLVQFRRSRLQPAAFCRQAGLSTASFYRWRHLLKDQIEPRKGSGEPSAAAFVDLGALASSAGSGRRLEVRLDLGQGLTLHLVRS